MAVVSTTLDQDTLFAIRIPVVEAMTIDQLMFELTTTGAAGTKMRMAVYDEKGDGNIYPDNLLCATAEVDCTTLTGNQPRKFTAAAEGTLPLSLAAGQHVWLVIWNSLGAVNPKINFVSVTAAWLGLPALTGAVNGHLTVASAYSSIAFPNPFPSGGALQPGTMPLLAFRRSA